MLEHGTSFNKFKTLGISLVVQRVRLHASTAGGTGLIPCLELRSHMLCGSGNK